MDVTPCAGELDIKSCEVLTWFRMLIFPFPSFPIRSFDLFNLNSVFSRLDAFLPCIAKLEQAVMLINIRA